MAYAPYDWLQAYDAAQSNVYGDSSQYVIQRIMQDVGPDYQKALDAGIIAAAGGPVDWSKAPKQAGGDLSGNAMYNSVGGRFGFGNPWSGKPTESVTGNYINDPNYGMQAVVQKRAPDSPEMQLMRAGSFALAGGTMAAGLAPLLSSATGLSSQFSQLLARLLISQGTNLGMGGNINPGSLAGSAVGGYYGGSAGSATGGLLGSLLSGR